MTIPKAAEASEPTINSALGHLISIGIVREVTGKQRHRVFAYPARNSSFERPCAKLQMQPRYRADILSYCNVRPNFTPFALARARPAAVFSRIRRFCHLAAQPTIKRGDWEDYKLVNPALYLYRHSLELLVKDITRSSRRTHDSRQARRRTRSDGHCGAYLEWHLRRAWAPLVFEDDTLEQHRQSRDPVAPAEPTPHAHRKKTTRRTADGLPLHSFDSLIAELCTCGHNICRLKASPDSPPFTQTTQPTEIQRRALELIETFPVAELA